MENLKMTLIIIFIATSLVGIYILLVKNECRRRYEIRELKPQKVDEKGKDLYFCVSYCIWQEQKQQLIKQYYRKGSIIEDEEWDIDYRIENIRGPYRREQGLFWERELLFCVNPVQRKEEIVVDNILVKVYSDNSYRFNIEKYRSEIEVLYWCILQNNLETNELPNAIRELFFMLDTNLMNKKTIEIIKAGADKYLPDGEKRKLKIYHFLCEMLKCDNQYECSNLNVSQEGGQFNLAQGNGKIDAVQNIYVNIEQKSNFARRLDRLIDIMNEARKPYEEPITVGYICEYLGEDSENLLRQYYATTQEPKREFMKELAGKLGVNKIWLSKDADVEIFNIEERKKGLRSILDEIPNAEKMYIAIEETFSSNYLLIILKFDDIKYVCYDTRCIFFLSSGRGDQGQLMALYDFLRKVKGMRNKEGKEIYPNGAYFLSEEKWSKLEQGNIYPAAIRQAKNYKSHIMDDFLDIYNAFRDKEQYQQWYGEEFVKCQEYIRERLEFEERDYI